MAGWFDENAPRPGRTRPRVPADVPPPPPPVEASGEDYGTSAPANNGAPSNGNTGVSGTGPGGTPPPPVTPPAGRGVAPTGVDAAKWAAGHTSPKYAFMDISRKYDQRTEAGRNQTLAELQQQYPQWFSGWGIQGDKLKHLSGPLAAEWDGYNEFDAWRGSKVGEWAPQWIPTQLNGQAYQPEGQAAPVAAQTAPSVPPAASAPVPMPAPMQPAPVAAQTPALTGPVSNLTPAAQTAQPVGSSSPMSLPPQTGQTFGDGGYGVTSGQGMDAGFGSLLQPWEWEFAFPYFNAPKGSEVYDDPGYQFRQDQGQKAIQRSAAAQGTVLNPGTVKSLDEYSQGLASQEYGNVYNRRLGEHGRAHDQAFNEYTSAYNTFNRNQDAPFNRLAAIAGLGQTSAGQLGASGSAFAGNYGNALMQGAGAQGDYLTQGANAGAAGRVGSANAWSHFLGNTANSIGQSYYANQFLKPRTPAGSPWNFGTSVDVNGLG